MGFSPAMAATLTIRPAPRALRCGAAARQQEGTAKVCGHRPVPDIRRQAIKIGKGYPLGHGRVVDEDIQASKGCRDTFNDRVDGRRVGLVEGEDLSRSALRAHGVCCGFGTLGTGAISYGDMRAGIGEVFGDRATKSSAGSRYEGDLVGKVHFELLGGAGLLVPGQT
jgi:hypothetical protein